MADALGGAEMWPKHDPPGQPERKENHEDSRWQPERDGRVR